jgi:hypothetical protein
VPHAGSDRPASGPQQRVAVAEQVATRVSGVSLIALFDVHFCRTSWVCRYQREEDVCPEDY